MDLNETMALALKTFTQPYKVAVPDPPAINLGELKVYPNPRSHNGYAFQGYICFQGLDIDIENLKGGLRMGCDRDGTQWVCAMHAHYGEFRSARGSDGDKLDVYVGDNPSSDVVVVVHQSDPSTGVFDENKVMVGFDSEVAALECYLRQYNKPGFYGGHDVIDVATLKARMMLRKGGLPRVESLLSKAIGSFDALIPADYAEVVTTSPGEPMSVAEMLRGLLGQAMVFRDTAQSFHWNVTGPLFPQLHELFGEQYELASTHVDEVAERIRQMGEPVNPGNALLAASPSGAADMAADLAMQAQSLIGQCERALAVAEAHNDVPTVDMLTRHAAAYAKAAWFLRSTAGLQKGGKQTREDSQWSRVKRLVNARYGDMGGRWALAMALFQGLQKGSHSFAGVFTPSIGGHLVGSGSLGALVAYAETDLGDEWIEITESEYNALEDFDELTLVKGAGHKHYRKVPTGKHLMKMA